MIIDGIEFKYEIIKFTHGTFHQLSNDMIQVYGDSKEHALVKLRMELNKHVGCEEVTCYQYVGMAYNFSHERFRLFVPDLGIDKVIDDDDDGSKFEMAYAHNLAWRCLRGERAPDRTAYVKDGALYWTVDCDAGGVKFKQTNAGYKIIKEVV